jgi:hypothetical protein
MNKVPESPEGGRLKVAQHGSALFSSAEPNAGKHYMGTGVPLGTAESPVVRLFTINRPKSVSPLRGLRSNLHHSQGSATLHPGLTSGRPSGAWVRRFAFSHHITLSEPHWAYFRLPLAGLVKLSSGVTAKFQQLFCI